MAEPDRMSKLMGQKLELKSWKKFQLNEVPPQENFQLSRFDRILCLYERLQADSGRQARMRDHTQLDQNPIEMDVRSKGPDHNGVCLRSFKINDTWLIKKPVKADIDVGFPFDFCERQRGNFRPTTQSLSHRQVNLL